MEPTNIVAIVTGSAGGLGRKYAEYILTAGGRVVLTDINKNLLDKTLEELQSTYGQDRVTAAQQNVTVSEDWDRVFEASKSHFARPANVLINNAGIGPAQDFHADNLNQVHKSVIEINLTSVLRGTQVAIHKFKELPEGEEGVIVNISSIFGVYNSGGNPDYAAAKAGVAQATRAMAFLKGKQNVRVTAVAPGIVETPMTKPTLDAVPGLSDAYGGIVAPETLGEAMMESLKDTTNAGKVLNVFRDKRFYAKFNEIEEVYPPSE